MSLVEEGVLDARLAPSLRIHLDWIQYKTNFRDPVIVRRTTNPQGQTLPLAEIAIDLRQADGTNPDELARAVRNIGAGPEANGDNHVYLDEFKPYRDCLIWSFNRLFWRHLGDWEAASGKGFEAALPGGSSDANHPQAVSDAVADFWTLLRDLDNRNQLPPTSSASRSVSDRGARGRLARSVQGSRRAVRHQLLLASALHPGRLLANQPRAGAPGGGASRRARERHPARRAESREVADQVPLQADVRAPHERLRQPAVRRFVRRDGKLYLVEVRAYLNGPAWTV